MSKRQEDEGEREKTDRHREKHRYLDRQVDRQTNRQTETNRDGETTDKQTVDISWIYVRVCSGRLGRLDYFSGYVEYCSGYFEY